ncbi:MAG: TetR/AcrR family transcriptional regulator [Gaiellales bacterium]
MEPDRRTRILEATCRVIAADGAPGVRAGAIAREAGVSRGLPLYYWPTVEAIVLAAFAHHEEREWARSDRELAGLDDPLERLRFLLLDEIADTERARTYRAIWAEYERIAAFDPDVRALVRARGERWEAALARARGAARGAGRIRADVDPETAAARLGTLAVGLIWHLRCQTKEPADVRALLEGELAALALRG